MILKREFTNGLIIYFAIGAYFLLMEVLGLSNVFWLRFLNFFIVLFGINLTITANLKDGVKSYISNLVSAFLTGMIGAVLGIASLLAYISYKGGEVYLQKLSHIFLFGGGTVNEVQYSIGLFFESSAATAIIAFCMMQYYKSRSKIDKVPNP